MKTKLLSLFRERILSPLWILTIDLLFVHFAFGLAYVARLNFKFMSITVFELVKAGYSVIGIYVLAFLIFRSYRGVIRHTELTEIKRVFVSTSIATVAVLLLDTINRQVDLGLVLVPRLVTFIHGLLTAFLMIGFRMVVRETYLFLAQHKTYRNVLIYGAGDLGLIALEALRKSTDMPYKVMGFIDDDPRKWKTFLRDIPVASLDCAIEKALDKNIKEVVIAIADIPKEKIEELTDIFLQLKIEVKIVPAFHHWMSGQLKTKPMRQVKIEDLLGRDEIQLNLARISSQLNGSTVLITGAAGSIGSEIVRQLVHFPIKKLLLLDQAESALYDLQQELKNAGVSKKFELVIANISNAKRMRHVFVTQRPTIVFNAAAYKHVPLMEENPYEAINVNIKGTKTLADLAVEFRVKKFVMVSTDKAVNPTNVMGASKRICEMYIQALAQVKNVQTSFITTRFGNVLGSNGSVVPLFRKQIENGGPLTLTHPEITRYFMTIPEACRLVLEAGFMGTGGEIFVFDMGKPVKIYDLAKRMIELSGLRAGTDIDIKITGLRPGEKLYEELLADKENTQATHHPKIKIGKVRKLNYKAVNLAIEQLLAQLDYESAKNLVARMKELVPEFQSKNSTFESLDRTVQANGKLAVHAEMPAAK